MAKRMVLAFIFSVWLLVGVSHSAATRYGTRLAFDRDNPGLPGAQAKAYFSPEASSTKKTDAYEFQTGQQTEYLYYPVKKLTRKRFIFSAVTPKLQRKTIPVDNMSFDQFLAPGGKLIGQIGRPGLPGFARLVLVPQGAQMRVRVTKGEGRVFEDAFIYPMQPDVTIKPPQSPQAPVSQTELQAGQGDGFVFDKAFYQKDFTYPERMYDIRYDWIRGCRVAIVSIHTAQYNPYQKKLIYFPNLQVDIQFVGGNSNYFQLAKRSVYLEQTYAEVFANYKVIEIGIPQLTAMLPLSRRCDLLIVTPTVFEDQANALAQWKREKGFITRVATLDDIERARGGTSAEDIRAYIRDIYNGYSLSYVLLLGDAELIPPHYVTPLSGPFFTGTLIGTDLYYAEMDGEGHLPDLGVGRISVDTTVEDPESEDPLEEVGRVIDKIIAYEQTPPNDPGFYESVLHMAFFQDWTEGLTAGSGVADGWAEKPYVEPIEEIRNFFMAEGYSHLPRQYYTDQSWWPEGHSGPQWYLDRTPIPVELHWPGFAWDGGPDGISEEINAGCFLALYRGHGDRDGWCGPVFKSNYADHLSMLHNGSLTPVTLSFTCETGWFDNETDDETVFPGAGDESFAEKFLRMEGGTVAIVAATRPSLPVDSNQMIEGFVDCIWSDMLRGYPGDEDGGGAALEGSHRLGDALNYAKFYNESLVVGELDVIDSLESLEMFNLLGDPTMEIWTASPYVEQPPLMDPGMLQPLVPFRPAYRMPVEIDGVRVSLIQNGTIVAQGVSEKGWVQLRLTRPLSLKSGVSISFHKQGHLTETYPLAFRQVGGMSGR